MAWARVFIGPPRDAAEWLWLAATVVPDVVLLACVLWLVRALHDARKRLADVARQHAAPLQPDRAAVHLRQTLEGMLDPYVILQPVRDAGRHVVDFTCLDVNRAACAWLRVDRDRLMGSPFSASFPAFDSSGLLQALAALADTGRPLVLDDFPFMSRGGGLRRLDLRGMRGAGWISLLWRDVTIRHEAIEKLSASEEQFRLLAENSTDVILRLDPGDQILWISPSVASVLGWTPAEAIGRDGRDFLASVETREQYVRDKARVMAGQGAVSRALVRAASGDLHWMEVHSFPYRTAEGVVSGMVASMHLIDAQVRMEQDLEYRARVDSQTGLLNRGELLERLGFLVDSHEPNLGVLWCDIDGFKGINDAHGHATGDVVLEALGTRIRGSLRSAADMAGRMSGDELIVVLHGVSGLDEAVAFAETLRHRAAEPVSVGGSFIRATISVGVTLAGTGEGVDAILARADDAMYEAKRHGKNRVVAIPTPQLVRT